MEALLDVEAALGIRIEDDEAAAIGRVDDLVRLAASRLGDEAPPEVESDHSWTRLVNEAGPEHLPPVLRAPRGPASRALLRGLLALTGVLARVFFRLKVKGRERLPQSGPLLLCPNHVSFLDGFMLGAALPWRLARHAFVLGENMYISRGPAAPLARFAGIVPTDSSRHLRGAMQVGAAGLRGGRALLLFPEGIRSANGRLQPLKQGAAILASELGTPIVPVLIEGTFQAWPRGRRWPRPHPVELTFGEALDPGPLRSQASSPGEAQRLITSRLRQALLDLGAPGPEGPR
jgi:long-chain acyl-CoA synthetase